MKTTRAHAQDLAAFAFNTGVRIAGNDIEVRQEWLDTLTDEFERQVRDIEDETRREVLQAALRAVDDLCNDALDVGRRQYADILYHAKSAIRALLDSAGREP